MLILIFAIELALLLIPLILYFYLLITFISRLAGIRLDRSLAENLGSGERKRQKAQLIKEWDEGKRDSIQQARLN